MTNINRSSNSNYWLREHFSDRYVQQAWKKRLKSRAFFKLAEIQQKYKIFQPGVTVIDLGASPGAWSQYAATQIGKMGRVIACDILPMDQIYSVDFLQGDLRDKSIFKSLCNLIGNNKAQIVMSDMAPNICGISLIDIPRAIYLAKIALKLCKYVLESNGSFIVKIFQGEDSLKYLSEIRVFFTNIKISKPCASRSRSREVYVVATGYKR